jgi:hypothetical protein
LRESRKTEVREREGLRGEIGGRGKDGWRDDRETCGWRVAGYSGNGFPGRFRCFWEAL